MLIKEYRILLPMTVDEYRIAQLYMIQKKSRLDSSGEGSGIEIITNKPYTNGPGGSGQYTFKIYHIRNKIPAWIRSVLPSNALEAHEEAWNAYPFTRTRYSCPLMNRFLVEVETLYLNDAGQEENVFSLSENDLKNRIIDVMDFVKDPIPPHDYCPEEDPKLYHSVQTGRGPLTDDWVQKQISEGRPLMCAYKICRVEFRYWGLQTRAERWIQDSALRNTMLRAHRQAWAWQDEWVNLTIADIRLLEEEVAKYLSNVMASSNSFESTNVSKNIDSACNIDLLKEETKTDEESSVNYDEESKELEKKLLLSKRKTQNIEKRKNSDNYSNSDDVFYDCFDKWSLINANVNEEKKLEKNKQHMIHWNSELLLTEIDDDEELSTVTTPKSNFTKKLIILIFHGDIFPDNPADTKTTDATALNSTLEFIIKNNFPQLKDRVKVLLVSCGKELVSTFNEIKNICSDSNAFYPSFSLLLSAHTQSFNEAIQSTIKRANEVVSNFLESEFGYLFKDAEIFAVGDYVGGLLLYETLQKKNYNDKRFQKSDFCTTKNSNPNVFSCVKDEDKCSGSLNEISSNKNFLTDQTSVYEKCYNMSLNNSVESVCTKKKFGKEASIVADLPKPKARNLSTSSIEANDNLSLFSEVLSFKPKTAFLLGCPLAFVLMDRKLKKQEIPELECEQLFNLYYPLDSCGGRLEPVLNTQLSTLQALNVPRYKKMRISLSKNENYFYDNILETPMIWGNRRVDYKLYCPPEMILLPFSALPNILHASYWESKDVGEFILRNFLILEHSNYACKQLDSNINFLMNCEIPPKIWNRRRTRFKVANLNANHRANDLVIVHNNKNQNLIYARFCYGPMDLVALSLENVLVYICPFGKKWELHSKEMTDSHGRLTVKLKTNLSIGLHTVRMIVQGDHSFLNMYVAIVPSNTECVVFSIDGSLTNSVSVTGRDPRVRPGAVDVVRFWQQQDYLIIYVTARPDMQQRFVANWLTQHNFPHGLLFFTPTISTDPLKQKAQILRQLIDQKLSIHAAYGSAKDVNVYASLGVEQDRIFKVGSRKKLDGSCVSIDDGYAQHLHSIQMGEIPLAQKRANVMLNKFFSSLSPKTTNLNTNKKNNKNSNLNFSKRFKSFSSHSPKNFLQRTTSFKPRSGKFNLQ